MSRVYDKPITIQKVSEKTELWEDVYQVHAKINKASKDNEYLNAGAIQAKRSLTFEIRYFAALEEISFHTQAFRLIYKGVVYDIKDYDDPLLQHRVVRLLGVSQ